MKTVSAPLRIDLCGGALDIQPIPSELGPTHIVSAAIDIRVTGSLDDHIGKGLDVLYILPPIVSSGSGLGSSGVMNLVWLALISDETHPYVLADRVYNIEKAMNVVGGTQDQFTSAFGGLLILTFIGKRVFVTKLTDSVEVLNELSKRLYLIDTGIRRTSTDMSMQFIETYKRGENKSTILQLNNLSKQLWSFLGSALGNIESHGQEFDKTMVLMLNSEWKLRQLIYPENKVILNDIMNIIRSNVDIPIGIKMLGAAGGGCMLLYAPLGTNLEALSNGVNEANCDLIKIKIDPNGIIINGE